MNDSSKQKRVLGVDVGGVILDFVPYLDTELGFEGDNYLETPEIAGAVDTLAMLNKGRFKNSIYLISKINSEKENRIRNWLHHHDFFTRTGIPAENLYTCLERLDKLAIASRLGITHFVDDRAEVMSHMLGTVPHLYLFRGHAKDQKEFADATAHMKHVHSWAELLKHLP